MIQHLDPIWITGIGAGTPHGWDYSTIVDSLIAGKSGIDTVRTFDISHHPSQMGAALDAVPCPPDWPEAHFQQLTRLERLTLWCMVRALQDSGYWEQRHSLRVGLVLGNATEWAWSWEDHALKQECDPVCDPQRDRAPLLATLQRALGLQGPVLTLSAACASGNFALAQARRWLHLGWVDICLAGGCDTALTPMTLAGFGNLRALSRRNQRPSAASRPFDKDRDGFVLGEGGVIFLLERSGTARKRSARVYGEFVGCGLTSDAYHPIIPCPDPVQSVQAIRAALNDARINASDVDYVNAHGTSTPVGDIAEARTLHEVFGERVMEVPVSSTKSMTGHLLTAAAALEALACLGTLERGVIPPTINLDNPDPECQLCHVANTAREQKVKVAISNSFGFGGSNSCAVFRAA